MARTIDRIRPACTLFALTVLVATASPVAANKKVADAPAFTQAVDSTYEQRIAADPMNKPPAVDSLVLPHAYVLDRGMKPQLIAAGRRLVPPVVQGGDYFWRYEPKLPIHEEYLAKRAELVPKGKRMELIRWCLANEQQVLAAYEARCATHRIWNFNNARYRGYHQHWLNWALKKNTRVAYSFDLPLRGEWYVIRDTTRHHSIKAGAVFAFDMVIKKNRRSYSGTGKRNADYYAWEQPIVAQADGVVEHATDKFPDLPPGKRGKFDEANDITVDYGGGIHGYYGHLKQGSLNVKVGDRVKRGDVLGLVGNSGASGSPHLHFTLVDPMGTSIEGRFNFEFSRDGRRWKTVLGENLIEGGFARSIETKPEGK